MRNIKPKIQKNKYFPIQTKQNNYLENETKPKQNK